MKKIMMAVVFLFITVSYCFAHPAKSIDVNFRNGGVDVIIHHKVDNPKTHYIDEVVIDLNGQEIIRQKNFAQTTKNELRLRFLIPTIEPGSKIDVKAHCNQGGDYEEEVEF